ncbi:MAG: hypothetical protein JJE29_03130 [Peptostreptococcaceae bacterium]|nr:hypothetical protein [Peptostreptococcaceae bacterium]
MTKRYKDKRNKRNKRNKTSRIILTILILCVFSALIGFYGVKFMLAGNDKEETTQLSEPVSELSLVEEFDEELEAKETEKVDADDRDLQIEKKTKQINVNLYAYQLGGFSSIENAETFLKELKENGEFGVILKENNFKVLNFVYENSALGEYFKGVAKEIVGDAFLFKIERTIQVSYPENEEEKSVVCIKDYERALSIIGEIQTGYIDYLNSNLTREALSGKIIKGIAEIESMRQRVEKLDSDDIFIGSLGAWYESLGKAFQKATGLEYRSFMADLSELYMH